MREVDGDLGKILDCAEVECSASVECEGCGTIAEGHGDRRQHAMLDLQENLAGWKRIYDPELNDGLYPYCPSCQTKDQK